MKFPDLLDAPGLLTKLCIFLRLLHPGKCVLLVSVLRLCVRLIDADDRRTDPANIAVLPEMESSSSDSQPEKFVRAHNLVGTAIHSFIALIHPSQPFWIAFTPGVIDALDQK